MLFNRFAKKLFSVQTSGDSNIHSASKKNMNNLSGKVTKGFGVGGTIVFIFAAVIARLTVSEIFNKRALEEHTKAITSGENISIKETGDFSIQLPDLFKESGLPTVNFGDSNAERLKCYEAKDIVVTVARTPYTDEEKKYIKSKRKEKYAQELADAMKNYSDSTCSVISSEHYNDNCILLKMNITKSGLFKGTDKVYMSGLIWYDDEYTYEADISCRLDDRSKYENSMEQWVKTFKVK